MAYDNPEAFGLLGLYQEYNGRQIGRFGREILELAKFSGDAEAVHGRYLKVLGVLGMHGTEVARSCVLYGQEDSTQAVMAEHLFWVSLRREVDGSLQSRDNDGSSHDIPGGVHVTYDRKMAGAAQIGTAAGEVALQYDALAIPPALRVIDVMGHIDDGYGTWGEPRSIIPAGMLTDIEATLSS